MATQPDPNSSDSSVGDGALPSVADLDQAMKDEARLKIEKGEQALDHGPGIDDQRAENPRTESGQIPGER